MKIAFSGPSGTGKTTLCKYVEETFKVPHLSTSASDVLSENHRVVLSNMGWGKSGHLGVIQESVRNPAFAISFQDFLLQDRLKQIEENKQFVIDRCPVDNMVYRLMQACHHDTWFQYREAYNLAIGGLSRLDLVIFIKVSEDMPYIEDNKSRIPNFHFQQYVSLNFEVIIKKIKENYPNINIRVLDKWDMDYRKRKVYTWIKELQTPKLFVDEEIC